MTDYEDWIVAYVAKHSFMQGMCSLATLEMVRAFPELKRVRGHVLSQGQHWWCVAPDGSIVDPTVSQFGYEPPAASYEALDESLSETFPTGQCRNCGGYLYYHASFCDESCHRSVLAECDFKWTGPTRYNPTDKPMYYEDIMPEHR